MKIESIVYTARQCKGVEPEENLVILLSFNIIDFLLSVLFDRFDFEQL